MSIFNNVIFQIFIFFFVVQTMLFGQEQQPSQKIKTIILADFLPYKSQPENNLSDSIKNKLKSSFENKGYTVIISNSKKLEDTLKEAKTIPDSLVIGGYYERNKNGNLNIYIQIYDPIKPQVIDAVAVMDPYAEIGDLHLDINEMKNADEKEIQELASKTVLRVNLNRKKNVQMENINDSLLTHPISKDINFPLPEEKFTESGSEAFRFISESQLNRKVEVASLFKEDELKVGSTVSVVDEAQWKKYGARKNLDAISFLPSVTTAHVSGGMDAMVIRGYTNSNSHAGVATMVDGVPINSFFSSSSTFYLNNMNLGSLNRIEMIRGPGSAIYGSDAFHGVYSMKTYESEKNERKASVETGTNGYYNGYARASTSLGEKIRIHVSGSGMGQGNQDQPYSQNLFTYVPKLNIPEPMASYPGLYNYNSVRDRSYKGQTGVAKIEYKATDRLTIKTGLYANTWVGNDFPGVGTRNSLLKDTSSGANNFYMGRINAEYKFNNDITLDAAGFFWKGSVLQEQYLYVATAPINDYVKLYQGIQESRVGSSLTLKQEKNAWNTQWIMSVSNNQFKITDSRQETSINKTADLALDAAFFINGAPWKKQAFNDMGRNINSAFVQTKTSFFKEKLFLILGGRLDSYSDFGNQAIPRAGIIFMPEEKTAIKFLYGRAFRAPNAGELSFQTIVMGNRSIKPEIIDSYEIVLQHKEKTWKSNFVLFENQWRDGIIINRRPGLPPPFIARFENKGQNESRGAELEFTYLNNKWEYMLGGSSIISKDMTKQDFLLQNYKTYEYSANDQYISNPNGSRYTLFPRYIFNTGIGYNFDWNKTNVYLIHRWMSDMEDKLNVGEKVYIPHRLKNYSRFDFTLAVEPTEHFECGLVIRNIFNRVNSQPAVWSNDYGFRDEGLNVSLRLAAKF